MAFLKDFGNKNSAHGHNPAHKDKDSAEVERINSLISEEENRINSIIFQIGKLYLEKHASDYENEFAALINEINSAQKRIAEYREQIQRVKNIIKCERCGAEVPNDSLFCSACGNPIPKRTAPKPPANAVICPSCGNQVKKETMFCIYCGQPMPAAQEALHASDPAPVTEKVCPACGFKTKDQGTNFCFNCGTKLVGGQERPPIYYAEQSPVNQAPAGNQVPAGNAGYQVPAGNQVPADNAGYQAPAKTVRKCPGCGFEIDIPELSFCTECGTKL